MTKYQNHNVTFYFTSNLTKLSTYYHIGSFHKTNLDDKAIFTTFIRFTSFYLLESKVKGSHSLLELIPKRNSSNFKRYQIKLFEVTTLISVLPTFPLIQ